MTGIVACLAAAAPNAIYGAGLYRLQPSTGADTSPISVGNQSSLFDDLSLAYEWIGYYRAASTGTVQIGAASVVADWYDPYSGAPYLFNWGSGSTSQCYIWTGATAISGYNSGNYTAFISDQTTSVGFASTIGVYYPIRIQWTSTLNSIVVGSGIYYSISSFEFQISGSSSVGGQIFYNTLTNGF